MTLIYFTPNAILSMNGTYISLGVKVRQFENLYCTWESLTEDLSAIIRAHKVNVSI